MMKNNKKQQQQQLFDAAEGNSSKVKPRFLHRMKNQAAYRKLTNNLPTIYENQMLVSPSLKVRQLENQITELCSQIKELGIQASKRAGNGKEIRMLEGGNNTNMLENKLIFPDGETASVRQ